MNKKAVESKKTSFSLKEPKFVIDAKEAYRRYKEKEEFWRNFEILATLLTTCILLVFAIRPAVVVVSGLLSEIKNKEVIFSKMRSKVGKVVEAQEEYARLQEKTYLLDRFYPVYPQVAWGVSQLVGLALENNLTFSSATLEDLEMTNLTTKKRKGELPGIGFSFSAEGRYKDISRFLDQLKMLARWVEVEQYTISVSDETSRSSQRGNTDWLTVSLSGRLMFFSPEPTPLVKAKAKKR